MKLRIVVPCLLVTLGGLTPGQANMASSHSGTIVMSMHAKQVPIDYSAPAGAPFTAEEVTVQGSGFTLAGTLLLAKTGRKPFPAVITIAGSGPQPRDEPVPVPALKEYRPFRQIAESLAAAGIAVLRVDDRGVG